MDLEAGPWRSRLFFYPVFVREATAVNGGPVVSA